MRGEDSGSSRSAAAAPLTATGFDHVAPRSAERENHTRQPELSPAIQHSNTSCFSGSQMTSGPSASAASACGGMSEPTTDGLDAQPESGAWSTAHASTAASAATRPGDPGLLAGTGFAVGIATSITASMALRARGGVRTAP